MVTTIQSKKSIHAPANASAKEEALKSFTATTKSKVDAAIKARNESAVSLYSAAAYAFFLGIVHGRWEQANRLFRDLPTIDSDALRQRFALRVNDKYAVDGEHEKDANGVELDTWVKRPTTMIMYAANPAVKGEHFALAKADGNGDAAENKRKLISAFREKVEAAGVEDMEAIEWLSRAKVVSAVAEYDMVAFQRQFKSLLIKAAKATGDKESGISTAVIESLMREVNMPKAIKAEIRNAYAADNVNTAKTETPKQEEKQEETQVAA